uniref:ChaN family lipoprotein n=1 Tax=Stappia sp. TaxID=1870903 RepID=UPI003BAC9D5B
MTCLAALQRAATRFALGLALVPLAGGAVSVADEVAAPASPPPFTLEEGRGHPLVGKIWSPVSASFVEPADVSRAVAKARFVLLGETHDNPDHHALQAHLVSEATKREEGDARTPSVVLEMLTRDLQPKVSAFMAEGGTAPGFGPAVGWASLGWPDFAMYRPIIAAALKAGLPIVAGDTPRAERREVARKGISALGTERAMALGLDQSLGATAEGEMLDTLEQGHCGLMPRESLTPLVLVQRLRDATLAHAMIEADRQAGQGAILIAGSGHVRRDLGAPWYLASRAPDLSSGGQTISVAFIEVRDGENEPQAYAGLGAGAPARFDFVWFTPRAARGDPCEGLKERFEKQGAGKG